MDDFKDLESVILKKIVERMELTDIDIQTFSHTAPLFASDMGDAEECMDLDSVDALELIVLIYDEWQIKVEESDMKRLRTVKGIADFVREKAHR